MKIGIPRALLYYRYHVLWNTFFQELGIETVISPHTNKTLMDAGSHYAIDENCLSSKLFFGHVSALEGKCDAVFVPRIANYGKTASCAPASRDSMTWLSIPSGIMTSILSPAT